MIRTMLTEIIFQLCKGNPGCLSMVVDVAKVIQPEKFPAFALTLAHNDLTGSRAYMLWNDACNRDTTAMIALVEKIEIGQLPMSTVEAHLSAGWCAPFTPQEMGEPEKGASK